MATLGAFILLTTFVVCIYAAVVSIAGARRGSDRWIDSGIGALYLTTALMTVASGIIVHAFVVGDYTIKYVQRYSDAVQPLFYKITSYWGGLDGSIMFWVFLLSVFGASAVAINRERHRELMPYVVAVIAIVEAFFLFLMIVHRNPFDTFLDRDAGRGPRAQSAAPEPVHGHPPAVALYGLRRHDHPVRVRHGGADHRIPRRLVAAGRPALDDGELAVPDLRPDARHDLGLRGAGMGRLLGLGSGRERGPPAMVHGDGVPALGDGPGTTRDAARLERHAGHRHVPAHDFRHVYDAIRRRAVGPRLWRGSPARIPLHDLHDRRDRRQLRLRDLPAAAACGRATSSTRGRHARPRSSPTTGSCCSPRSSSCLRRCSRR